MVQFEVKISEKEYIKYAYIRNYTSPSVLFLTLMGIIITGFVFLSYIEDKSIWDDPLLVFASVYLLIFLPLLIYFRSKKQYAQYPYVNEKTIVTATTEGIEIKGVTFEVKTQWSYYTSLKMVAGWLLLLKNNRANFFPITAFKSKEDLAKFIELAKQGGVKVKGNIKWG